MQSNQHSNQMQLLHQQLNRNLCEFRRRRIAAAAAVVLLTTKRKRTNKKRKHWVAPLFAERKEKGFFHASVPTLMLDDLRFVNYIRMSATQFENLLYIVGPDINKQYHIREPIPVAERLILTLRYLASGDSITSMSFHFLVGVTTASSIIFETCQAIWDNLWRVVMPTEFHEDMWLEISKNFEEMWNFPHCIGAIDGKHIMMQRPSKAGSSYFNYKGSHSIVLLAVCDAKYIFKLIDIGAYGRQSDGGIFRESEFGQNFENGLMNLPPSSPLYDGGANLPYCIVGDEAFPLKNYLMRPFPGKDSAEIPQRIYNYRLSRARRTIENSFGILASRWRIFRKPIIAGVKNVYKIVQATICLHNLLRSADSNEENIHSYVTPEMVDREDGASFIPGSWRSESAGGLGDITQTGSNNRSKDVAFIREQFLEYFNNEGAVPWQNDCIN